MKSAIYGDLEKIRKKHYVWGTKGVLFEKFGELKTDGFLIDMKKTTKYEDWGSYDVENLCVVLDGIGVIKFKGIETKVRKGFVFKIFTGQSPEIITKGIKFLSFQLPKPSKPEGEDTNIIKIVKIGEVPEKVYEYETLGAEIITCTYKKGIGLLKFTFPIDKIPIHRHPFSDRVIIPLSGKGYTYAEPVRYEIEKGKFTVFKKGTVHTNGPIPGEILTLLAVQLPWIESKIDEENIGGHEDFVKYIESVPPKKLWKKKEDLLRAAKRGVAK